MSKNNCYVCGAETCERVTVSAEGSDERLDIAACPQHKAAVKRQVRANLVANGFKPTLTPGRVNPKKHKRDRRRMRGAYLPHIPNATNTAMGPNDGIINKGI